MLETLLCMQEIDDKTFQSEVLDQKDVPVLVDFTATWCGPCKALSPVLESIAAELGGKVKVVKMDTDDSPETAKQLGVRGVPTLMAFRNGERRSVQVGVTSKANILAMLEK